MKAQVTTTRTTQGKVITNKEIFDMVMRLSDNAESHRNKLDDKMDLISNDVIEAVSFAKESAYQAKITNGRVNSLEDFRKEAIQKIQVISDKNNIEKGISKVIIWGLGIAVSVFLLWIGIFLGKR